MAEISETSQDASDKKKSEISEKSESASDFDPKTMRKTKPGLKRLVLTITLFFSFLLGLPFLLKSIEIYRSPLPFRDIDSLSTSIESNPLLFPCQFQAVFVDFDHRTSTKLNAEELGFSILDHMRRFTGDETVCGTCGNNYSVSVTLDSSTSCIRNQNVDSACSWKCGALNEFKVHSDLKDDEVLDEYLESVLGEGEDCSGLGGKVYTVVVVNRDDEVKAVVGKHRHAWIVGKVSEVDVVERIAEIFVKIFVNGGKEEGAIHGEFMPVGADGRLVLSFNLLNADPSDWIYVWDFQMIDEILLSPIIEALGAVANISVESQVLYHTPKSSFSYWDDKHESFVFSTKDLPFFVNSNEWHLDTSIAAGGRSKILQVVLPNGEVSKTNGFISPMWGGVIVWNPPGCLRDSESMRPLRRKIPPQDLQNIFEVFMGQLRQLFGLKSDNLYVGASGTSIILASERGFTEWELDVLSRQHTCFNLVSCATTLGSLSRLVQSLPRMIIMDEIGKQVRYSLQDAKLAQSNASLGMLDASAVSSRQARSLAEDAFFHPSIMSVSYFSVEHCFAVYSPFFLPVSLHVLLATAKEWKRYKQERSKYLAWKAKARI
ncbi:uncharacterized protein LOC132269148 isoform X2 [Cornus florida]|uniref:uncharacterized protein LOC132269148 isoform X2 n=1 Tax=Cornus florida TaxID=4283 RepID=UPI00289E3A78|nr:uncharacterized protein LOC132269148 isoform X2 [Cornus florida]